MKFDPSLSEQEWTATLRAEAARTWGPERARTIDETLLDVSRAIANVLRVPVSAEEEPYLIAPAPITLEDL
jgi:hypothetical protein